MTEARRPLIVCLLCAAPLAGAAETPGGADVASAAVVPADTLPAETGTTAAPQRPEPLPASTPAPAIEAGGDATLTMDFKDISLEAILEEAVVTTGSRSKKKLSRALSAITVIDRAQIEALPYLYLGDLLATVAGVDVRWGPMQAAYVGMRGLGGTTLSSRVLMLWNGQPRNAPLTGGLSAGHFVPLVDIERIEVIRGPGSSMYGANAFAGVVNVITRKPEGEKPFIGTTASVLAGSFGTSRVQAATGQMLGPVGVDVSVEGLQTDGPFPTAVLNQGGRALTVKNDGLQSGAASLALSYRGLTVTGGIAGGRRGLPGQFPTDAQGDLQACSSCHMSQLTHGAGVAHVAEETACGSCHVKPDDHQHQLEGYAGAAYTLPLTQGLEAQLSAFYGEWRSRYDLWKNTMFSGAPVPQELESRQRALGVEAHVTHTWSDLNNAVIGVEARRQAVGASRVRAPDGDTTIKESDLSVFVEDDLTPWHWLSLTAGGRLDWSTIYGTAIAPRGGIVFVPAEGSSIRATATRAFRNPNFNELYLMKHDGSYQGSLAHLEGNPELEPEWITTYEVGGTYQSAAPLPLRVSASAYYFTVDRLVSFFETGPHTAMPMQAGDATGKGVEVEGEVGPQGAAHGVRGFVNYAYQDVRDREGLPLPYAPPAKANAGVRLHLDSIGATVRARYVDARLDMSGVELPAFVTLDLLARLRLVDELWLSLWVTNLGDQVYQDSIGIPAARRGMFVSLSYGAF
ncbi:MAG: TonB-dependent receptor [Deltaproteobacteria bacterium]|nr:TonB-dependent receptor [Deltaproteobacteria bacterium]